MALFGNKKKTGEEKDSNKEEKKDVKKVSKKTTEKSAPSMQDLYAEKETKKTTSTTDTKNTKSKTSKKSTGNAYKVLVKPVVTEKATNLVTDNKYAFVVGNRANKIEIAKSVKAIYGVDVLDVNIIRVNGKKVTRGRIRGKRNDYKKAIVTIKKGQSISLYEGV
jgi:large subunit ribosomal protein L23